MDNDLIMRSEAKEEIMNWARSITNPKMLSVNDTMYVLENLPAVAAVEVVRCRDCRYWRHESLSCLHWICTQHSTAKYTFHTLPTFFCADGLRGDT